MLLLLSDLNTSNVTVNPSQKTEYRKINVFKYI